MPPTSQKLSTLDTASPLLKLAFCISARFSVFAYAWIPKIISVSPVKELAQQVLSHTLAASEMHPRLSENVKLTINFHLM